MQRWAFIFVIFFSGFGARASDLTSDSMPADRFTFYQHRYALPNVFQKLTDNHGDGFEPLYGTRNFRAVLSGAVYRGGANNAYHRTNKRSNVNPLPNDALENLCKEGFGQVLYMYGNHFESAPPVTTCVGPDGQPNQLTYLSFQPLDRDTDVAQILLLIHRSLTGNDPRPIYLHCWNGWHAPGLVSALALRQFCGWSAEQASSYWTKNTDGNPTDNPSILPRIREYQNNPALEISSELQARVCPSL